jgi:hypothetical protein
MVVLKRIGVLSAALIAALIALVTGFVFSVFTLIGVLKPFLGSSTCGGSGFCGILVGGTTVLVLIVFPIFAMVVDFVFAAIEAWLYNVVSGKVGGVKLEFKNNRLKNIDPMSAAKVGAVILAVLGFVAGVLFTIVGLFSGGALFGIISIVLLTILGLIVGFIAIGIVLSFKSDRLEKVGPMSYAKIAGIFGAIIGFLVGLLYTVISLNPLVGASSAMLPGIVHTVGAFAIVIFPIFYFMLTFLSAGLAALLYNYFAKRIKGIQVRFS